MTTKKTLSDRLNKNWPFDLQITNNLRKQVIKRFNATSQETLVGFALYRFSLNAGCKTDAEFSNLLNEMHTQIQDEPGVMKQILGDNFQYFENLFFRTFRL